MEASQHTKRNNWTREELIIAFYTYCKTTFSKINSRNTNVRELAAIIGRTNDAVALKLANFARLDPTLQKQNISGMSHGSKGEEQIWNEFSNRWDELAYESEKILALYKKNEGIPSSEFNLDNIPSEGKERETIVKARLNQNFFRRMVLASYNSTCCITGLNVPELLVAAHILPWASDEKNRMNPSNGLCLNALLDKAFDTGLITITTDYEILFSKYLSEALRKNPSDWLPMSLNRQKMNLPQRFHPSKLFLQHHNTQIFLGE